MLPGEESPASVRDLSTPVDGSPAHGLDHGLGYAPIPRDLRNHAIMRRPSALAIYVTVLTRARHVASRVDVAGGPVDLGPGECVIGQRELADVLGAHRTQIKRDLRWLEGRRLLELKVCPAGTVVKVCGFADFKPRPSTAVSAVVPGSVSTGVPTTVSTSVPLSNGSNRENGSNRGEGASAPPPDPGEFRLGEGTNPGTSKPRRKKQPAIPMPDGWVPGATALRIARELGVGVTHEAEKFRSWARSKGATYVDWDAAFEGWVRRASERPGQRHEPGAAPALGLSQSLKPLFPNKPKPGGGP